MSFEKSVLLATIMTLLDEMNSKEQKTTATDTQSAENNISVRFTFENLKSKETLINLADKLFAKADEECNTSSETDTPVLVSSLITRIVYESVNSALADYETKSRVYRYALEYCNVQTDFTWDALNIDDDHQLEKSLQQLSDLALNMIFVATTVGAGEELSIDFIRFLTELMMHLEDSIKLRFPTFELAKKPLEITLDYIIAAMEREICRLEEEDPTLKEKSEHTVDIERIGKLRNEARAAMNCEDTNRAAVYYKQIANLDHNDWEAIFYKDFCPAFSSPELVNTTSIHDNTKRISEAMARAMPLAKNKY